MSDLRPSPCRGHSPRHRFWVVLGRRIYQDFVLLFAWTDCLFRLYVCLVSRFSCGLPYVCPDSCQPWIPWSWPTAPCLFARSISYACERQWVLSHKQEKWRFFPSSSLLSFHIDWWTLLSIQSRLKQSSSSPPSTTSSLTSQIHIASFRKKGKGFR